MLPIFPSAYIDDSLLTAVFLGVLLLWVLAERLGWPATGLVVPGYLGAILAVRPDAAAVVVGEAVITAFLADLIGRRAPRWLPIDPAFGRDRFFLIILLSVFVRLGAEVWPGPELFTALGAPRVDGWHSIGLVLVPLTANALWKPGIWRGVPLIGFPVLTVFVLLRYVLLPYTNLSLVTMELTYADLEWTFLGAPRVYILLLVGAFIASHTTIRFGWDFGGIIVCGLLAIAWLDPLRVATTFAEALVVVLIVGTLTSIRPLKTANLSGLRPVVLAFTVSYLLKFTIAAVGQGLWPSFHTSDLFGFGYLLPALLATRVWRAGQATRIFVPTAVVSLLGFLVGTLVGSGLSLVGGADGGTQVAGALSGPARFAVIEALGPPSDEAYGTDEALAALRRAQANASFDGPNLHVQVFDDGVVISSQRGSVGALWLRAGGDPNVAVWVDNARSPGMAEAGLAVAARVDAGLVALDAGGLRTLATSAKSAVLSLHPGVASSWVSLSALPALVEPGEVRSAAVGEADRWRLAEEAVTGAGAPRSLMAPLRVQDSRGLLTYERGLVEPLLDRHLAVADAWATRMGATLRVTDDARTVVPPDVGPSALEVTLRRGAVGGGAPMGPVIDIRDPKESVVGVGRAWAAQTNARAWMVTHDPDADELAKVWLRDLARRTPALEVLSIARLHRDDIVGGDAVVFDGRPVSPVHDPTPVAERAIALIADAGFLPVLADGSVARARFATTDARRDAVEPAGGAVATIWLGDPIRRAYSGLSSGSPHAMALGAANIPTRPGHLSDWVDTPPTGDPTFDPLWPLLARYGATGHPGVLARLLAKAGPGARVWGLSDDETGRGFLMVEVGDTVGIAPIGYTGRTVRMAGVELPGTWSTR